MKNSRSYNRGGVHTARMVSRAAFIHLGGAAKLAGGGNLAQVLGTVPAIKGSEKPAEMMGHSLLV